MQNGSLALLEFSFQDFQFNTRTWWSIKFQKAKHSCSCCGHHMAQDNQTRSYTFWGALINAAPPEETYSREKTGQNGLCITKPKGCLSQRRQKFSLQWGLKVMGDILSCLIALKNIGIMKKEKKKKPSSYRSENFLSWELQQNQVKMWNMLRMTSSLLVWETRSTFTV